MPRFTEYDSLSAAFLGFSQCCREEGLQVGIPENQASLLVAVDGLWWGDPCFRYALRALFCHNPEEVKRFDALFDAFWAEDDSSRKSKVQFKNQSNIQKQSKSSLVMMGLGDNNNEPDEEAQNTAGANQRAALRKTDFSKVSQMESELLEELAVQLWKQMSLRLKRKTRTGKKGTVSLPKTIRRNLSKGGEMVDLVRKRIATQKYRLVVLLDVSGSMDKYSFYLLRFIHTLRTNFEHVEAFIFSTSLVRITDALDKKDLGYTLNTLASEVDNWSGGTKIGLCLKQFNEQYAKRALNGKTLTILLSDGLDTGAPEELSQELEKIRLRTRKLVWLNPLKGMEGYQPIQRGMQAALPSIAHFGAAHNIDSLLALENILIDA